MSKDSKEPLASKLCDYLGKRPSNPLPPAVVDRAFLEAATGGVDGRGNVTYGKPTRTFLCSARGDTSPLGAPLWKSAKAAS